MTRGTGRSDRCGGALRHRGVLSSAGAKGRSRGRSLRLTWAPAAPTLDPDEIVARDRHRGLSFWQSDRQECLQPSRSPHFRRAFESTHSRHVVTSCGLRRVASGQSRGFPGGSDLRISGIVRTDRPPTHRDSSRYRTASRSSGSSSQDRTQASRGSRESEDRHAWRERSEKPQTLACSVKRIRQ